jgi:hypothetical protein
MILRNFKTGWVEAFEQKIQTLLTLFPESKVLSIKRHLGMLRIEIEAIDKDRQYVINCVTYKIERESARICEICGKYGTRRDSYLPETMCLCWRCYALEVDALDQADTATISN